MQFIDQYVFQKYSSKYSVSDVADTREETVEFVEMTQKEKQLRDDHKYLTELFMNILAVKPPLGIRPSSLEAMHHVRWITKITYVFKI